MARFLLICLGGAVGTGLRYLLAGWSLQRFGAGFPYGTLAVNLVGSFVIGALMPVATTSAWFSPTFRLALTTGLLGGFTTYSAFNYESVRYLEQGAFALFALNVGVTVVGCLLAGILGAWLGRVVVGM